MTLQEAMLLASIEACGPGDLIAAPWEAKEALILLVDALSALQDIGP